MEIEQMESLVSTLEKGEVPASVAFLRFASLLHNNSKVVYGDVQGNPQNFISSHRALPVSKWGWV